MLNLQNIRGLDNLNDFYAKEAHKRAPLEGCEPSIERQQILSKLIPSKTLLLDIGCWNGSLSHFLNDIKYVGIDINRKALKKAKLKKIDVVLASCDYLPFKEETFDVCSMIEVIEHLYFPAKTLKEIHRVLVKNGKILLATPNFVNFIDRINVLMGKHPIAGTEHQHIRFFTWKTLNTLLRQCGFEPEKRENWFIPFPTRTIAKKYPLWRKIMRHAAKVFPNFDEGLLGVWRKFG
jgi:SAM-dependent methyltransferase